MKITKRIVSVILALLLVFGNLSLIASAAASDVVTINFKYYREVDGEWKPTKTIARGDTVKARMFIKTSFPHESFAILFAYPSSFMTHEYTHLEQDAANELIYYPTMNAENAQVSDNSYELNVVNDSPIIKDQLTDDGGGEYEPYLPESFFKENGWFNSKTEAFGTPFALDDSNWVTEYQFTVKDDATGNGYVFVPQGAIMAPGEQEAAFSYIFKKVGNKLTGSMNEAFTWEVKDPADYTKDEMLSLDNTVTFNDGTNTVTSTGFIGDKLAAEDVPADPAVSGKIFVGWVPSTVENPTEADVVDVKSIAYDYDATTYNALYKSADKVVTVKANYTDVTTNTAAVAPKDFETQIGNTVKIVETLPEKAEENTTYILYKDLPTVPNYEFDADNTPAENLTFVVTDEDAVMNINYKPVDYTATFDPANGEEAIEIIKAYYSDYNAPAAPEKANSKFTGWKLDGTDTVVDAEAALKLEGNVSFTAQYENVYNVTYTFAGEEIPEGVDAPPAGTTTAGATIAAPVVAEPDGWDIAWSVTGATKNDDGSYTAGANDVAFVGTWTKTPYAVTYVYAGEIPEGAKEPEGINLTIGDVIEEPEVEVTAGYELKWTMSGDVDGKMGTAPVTMTGTWSKIPYDVTYTYAGDVPAGEEAPADTTATVGETITLTTPAAEGYTFKGWAVNGAEYNAETGVVTIGTTDVTITGTWAKNYVVNYVFAGSGDYPEKVPTSVTAPEAETVNKGDTVDVPENPTADGFTFIEWTVEGAAYDAESDSYIVGDGDVTVTGTWEAIAYKYRYYLDDEKTVLFTTKTYTYGDTPADVDLPTDEQLSAKGFDGWTAYDWTADIAELPETVKSDVDFIVDKEQKEYYVEFYNRNDEALGLNNDDTGIFVFHGEKVDPSIVVESADVEGYTATGKWHIGDAEGEIATFPYAVKEDTAFYADYTINQHNIIYYADEEGKSEYEKFTVDYNTVITADHVPAGTPAKEGWSFVAWIEETTGSEIADYIGLNMPDEDVKVYPTFEINEYTITWVIDGKEQSAPQTYGEKIVAPDVAAKEGYTFKGWSATENGAVIEDLGTVPASNDTKFYAVFAGNDDVAYTINKYFMNTSGTYEGVEAETETAYGVAGKEVTYTPAAPEGFTFDGTQANVLEGTIAGNGSLELTVYYSRNKVNVTINGVTEEKYYGEEITEPEEKPEGDPGYEFDKWVDEDGDEVKFPVTVGTDPIVIKPEFKAATDTEYIIEIYVMDTEGKYSDTPDSTETKTGETGTEATYTPDVKEGFTPDAESYTTVIKGDTSDTIKVYYSRNKVNVTINGVTEEKYYGEEITEPEEKPEGDPGYEFDKWVDEDGEEVKFPVTVGTDPIVIKPTFKAETDTEYIIEIYVMDTEGKYSDTPDSTETKTGETDTEATYTPDVKEGFTPDAESYTTIIKGDTSDTIKVYYSRNKVNVTINGVTEEKYYGEEITEPEEKPEGDPGYEFDKWVDEDGDEVKFPVTVGTDPIVIKPTFKAETDTEYIIEIYVMDTEGKYSDTPDSTETKTGETNTEATYTPDVKEGFTPDKESYTTVIKGDTSDTIKVYYSRNKVNVTINDKTEEKYYGEEITEPAAPPAPEGEEFVGWVDADDQPVKFPITVGTDPIVIKPDFAPIKYTVTFIVPGMTEAYASGEFDHGSAIEKPADPTVAGYEFKGWSLTEKGEVVDPTTMTVPVDGITFYAILEANTNTKYTVKKFYMNEAGTDWMEPVDDVRYGTTGDTVTLDFAKEATEGFTIDEVNSTKSADIAGDGNTVLVIYYNRNKQNVTINNKTEEKYYGEEIETPETPKAEPGYTFGGWVDENDQPVTFPITVGTEDIVIKPVWNKLSYNLTFKNSKGEVISGPTSTEFGAAITAPEIEDKEGYTFIGWIAEVTGEKFNGTMPAKDVVYVETWNDGNYVPYKVETWIMNLDGDYELTTEAYGSALTGNTQGLTANEIPGFTVDTEKSVLSAVIVGDGSTVLKAYYARDKYTVTFDGENAQQIFFGKELPVVEPDAQTGKTFTGWVVEGTTDAAPATMPAEDLALVSTWSDTEYTITYIVEGKIIATDKYIYGADVTAPEDPEVYGKKFVEWAPAVPATMPAENLIISAIFDSAIYKVTFVDFDGNAFVEMQVRAGDAIVLPVEEPTKEFYTFEGWLDVPATMPAEDITIKPDFERVPVVLVPEDGSTTVIDRENMVIYGLEIFLDEALIDEYLAVEGDGYYTVTPVANGCYGTGTVIEVYDRLGDGTPLETFHIVIFGDLNGDARINAVDTAMADDESLMLTDWSLKQVYENGELVDNENYKVYMAMAADVNGKDGRIDAQDVSDIRDTSLLVVDINQVDGIVEQ